MKKGEQSKTDQIEWLSPKRLTQGSKDKWSNSKHDNKAGLAADELVLRSIQVLGYLPYPWSKHTTRQRTCDYLIVSVGNGCAACDLLDMLAMMPMFASFFHLDHDLGLDSSSFENSMSYDICQTDDSVVYLQTRHLPGAHLARRFLNLARVVKFRPTHRAFFEVA